MSAGIGDLTQIPVTTRPTQAIPALGKGVTVTLYNTDLTNNVYVSYQQWFTPGNLNSIPIRPLQSVPFDASKPLYIAAQATGQANVLVLPGATQIQPSPADAAASINALGLATSANQVTTLAAVNAPAYGPATLARQITQESNIPANIAVTGVPALNLKSTVTAANAVTIAAGATQALTAVTGINQPAYNLHLTATAGGASTQPWYTVTIKWVDTASGFTVQVDAYTAYMSGTSNVLSTVIAGPTDADQCQISVTNGDTVSMTLNTAFFVLSSRTNYTTDVVYQYWTTASQPAIPTFQLGNSLSVPTGKVLFEVTRSLGIGLTTSPRYALPVYSGQVHIHFDGTGSNNWDVPIFESVNGTVLWRTTLSGAPALTNAIAIFPRVPISLQFTNNGSVSGNLNCMISAL